MDNFLVAHDVPILDEYESANQPEPFRSVDKALLEKIVDINNRRMADTGDEIPIVATHTKPGDPQPIIGYASGLYVGKFGRINPRACIFARDWKIFEKHKELANERPRRSVEIFTDTLEIDPIALCGASTPQRHLGHVHFTRGERDKIMATFEEESKMENEELIGKIFEALTKILEKLEPASAEKYKGEKEPEPEPEPPKKHTAKLKEKDDEKEDEKEDEKVRMARDQGNIQYRKLQEEVEKERTVRRKLEGEVSVISRELRRARFERGLAQIEHEGVMVDRATELDRLQDFGEEAFAGEIERMRSNYKRSPVGIRITDQSSEHFMRDGGEIVSQSLSPEQARAKAAEAVRSARSIAAEKGISESEAYKMALEKLN